jgi:hypothetical protein
MHQEHLLASDGLRGQVPVNRRRADFALLVESIILLLNRVRVAGLVGATTEQAQNLGEPGEPSGALWQEWTHVFTVLN